MKFLETHTHNFVTHNFVTHNFVTYKFVTHNFVTICHTQLCHIQIVTPRHFCVAGVALGDICRRFTWQAWHSATSTFVLRGRRGTYGTVLALVTRLGAALRRGTFAWQAWHLATSAVVSRGRRSARRHLPSFCVAGVVLGDIYFRFAWQAWYLWDCAGSGGALGRRVAPRHFCVAGVALGGICRRFTWQAWHSVTSTFVSRGRRGTYGTVLALVARLGAAWRRGTFAWQAWRLAASAVVSRGRRGTR